jgi:lipid II:glycine glycyltransferase (peptidoglycan interpeptide bridge formation enzyme)
VTGSPTSVARIASVVSTPPSDWDARAVEPPGGHVLQGTAWAAHRATLGWEPHFATFEDGRVALVLTHRQRPLPGFVAYAPRGPISSGDPPDSVAERAAALAGWARETGGTILAVDPELAAAPAYDAQLAAAGFAATEEIQPSRHRLVLTFEPGDDTDAVHARFTKSTRQRIRAAEKAGITVTEDPKGTELEAFGALIGATAERKHFTFSAEQGFTRWWRRVLETPYGRFWVARHDGRLVGGLIAYRQGGHLATAFSADRAELRRELPGTMHLLRWHVIREALEAGLPSIDLGGVDVRGARRKPEKGEPNHGMWEHKASFGAEWIESAAAHEIVLRPLVYRAGLLAGRARRLVRDRLRR